MSEPVTSRPQLPCLCASFRRASRALTQHYDEALRRLGLRTTQFTVLQVLSRAAGVSQGELGQTLAMDSTTLTRTLAILARRGWIAKRRGDDGRERRLGLTRAGAARLQRALAQWTKVQARLRRQLGDKRWNDFLKMTNEVTNVVTD